MDVETAGVSLPSGWESAPLAPDRLPRATKRGFGKDFRGEGVSENGQLGRWPRWFSREVLINAVPSEDVPGGMSCKAASCGDSGPIVQDVAAADRPPGCAAVGT